MSSRARPQTAVADDVVSDGGLIRRGAGCLHPVPDGARQQRRLQGGNERCSSAAALTLYGARAAAVG